MICWFLGTVLFESKDRCIGNVVGHADCPRNVWLGSCPRLSEALVSYEHISVVSPYLLAPVNFATMIRIES